MTETFEEWLLESSKRMAELRDQMLAVVVAAIANGSPTSAFMVRSFRRTGHG